MNRRRLIKLAGGMSLSVGAVSALLASCGGDDSGSQGTHPRATSLTTDTSQTAKLGGTLRVALTGEPPNLDIYQTTDSIVVLVASHMYETLFTWDAAYRPVPLLAASHVVSEDGLLNTITLRQGVPFHNGAEMQAADVIASVERWGGISGLGQDMMAATEEIVAVDPYTIEFRMSEPFGTFAMALARQLQGCVIYPRSVIDASDDISLADYIGTGPYRFVEWLPDQHILLERFDDYASPDGEPDGYAGAKAQHLDAIEFIPVRNEASRIAGMQAADYHYVETVSPDQLPGLEDSSAVATEILPSDSWLNIVLNLRSPVLQDLRIRRAIQVALDHEAIMLAAFGEGFYELTPELVPGAPTWYTEAGKEYFNQNIPDEARRLLDEVGYDGAPLRIMTTQEVQQEYNATLTMKQQLEAVGFVVELLVYDGATLSDRRNDETLWEMYTAWASFRPDPVMRNLTSSATGWWEDAEKDQLLADLQSESDYDKRFAIWEQVQLKFYKDVPRLKIGNSRRLLVRSTRLQNIGPTELQPEFSNSWLEE
jgi:peptide/nickel transport system substrate-binding protein